MRLIRPCLPTSEDLLRSLTEHSLTQLNTLTMAPHRYSHPHWCEAPEPKPLLPVADGPEVEHVGALGLHLVHLLSNVGGEKTLKMGGLKLHLFRTGTGYKGFTSGSSWGSCLLIGQHKTLSVHACQPHSTDVTYRVEMSPDEMSPDDR